MQVGKSAYYDWSQRPAKVISAETLHLYRQAKALFKASRESLGSRELVKKCSGLMVPDTLIRDNIYQLLWCGNGAEKNEQLVYKRI